MESTPYKVPSIVGTCTSWLWNKIRTCRIRSTRVEDDATPCEVPSQTTL